MSRPTMSLLITRVRNLIGDLNSTPTFTDDDIQAELDRWRTSHNNWLLRSEPQRTNTGGLLFVEHFADAEFWESDARLRKVGGTTLTPDTADYLLGYFTFTAGQLPPVLMDGKTFDVYGAAAELLTRWAATLKDAFDFSDGGGSYGKKGAPFSQVFRQYEEMAAQYRRRQLTGGHRLARPDADPRLR